MTQPLVSVVIPAYNAERYLKQTVNSVIAQSLEDWELIIVDDGSTDGTPAIIRELIAVDPRVKSIATANAGPNPARNAGFAAASTGSRFAAFLDSDDLWEPNALETLVAAHAEQPDCVIVFGDARYIDSTGVDLPDERPQHIFERLAYRDGKIVPEADDAPITFETLLVGNRIQTPGCALIPVDTIRRIGGFDERLKRSEDWHYWMRAALRGKIVHCAETVLAYRIHPQGLSRDHDLMLDQAGLAMKLLAMSGELSSDRQTAVEYVYALRMGIGAGRIAEWDDAVRMTGAVTRRKRLSATEKSTESVNGALLMALQGDAALADRIARTESEHEADPASSGDIARIAGARQRLLKQSTWINSRLAVRALRRRDIASAVEGAYRCGVDSVRSIYG